MIASRNEKRMNLQIQSALAFKKSCDTFYDGSYNILLENIQKL